ncbi:MAG TPA: PAS domain-containing protein [Gemmataceae bacterium]|nr:PAS domain-containing protein [Gemmataceae bacterium]
MFRTPLQFVFRPIVLVVAVIALAVLFADRDPVPFPYLLAGIVPSCLLGVWLVQIGMRREAHESIRVARLEADDKLDEFVRVNAELSRELLESRLLEQTHQLQVKAFDAFLQGVTITDPNLPGNPVVYANEGFTRLTGYTREEIVGRNCRVLHGADTAPAAREVIREAIRQRRACFVEILNYRKDGTPFWNALSIAPIIEDGQVTNFVGVQTDITSFKQMEAQLRQSQKMEAVGHLAGGVAHDFNNLLTVINGCCELIRASGDLPQDSAPLLDEVHRAGERAANLTRQLLAFSRKTVLQPRVLALGSLVTDFEKLVARLIGEDIHLCTEFHADPGMVRVDPGQMEQVLMNLVVNARDAMPRGGTLTIATREVFLDEDYVRVHDGLKPGQYVLLTVSDTGCGMDKATLGRMFEPFFSTKPVGKGTGLGLAMVYGIMKASGGHVAVESEVDHGTTFHLFLPSVAEPKALGTSRYSQALHGGTETVLLVEDEAGVRRLAKQALESRGYHVLEAQHGAQALELCEHHVGKIDLLLSDVVMPNMSGRELGERIAAISPQTKVIFTSGYTDDAIVRHGVYRAGSDFIQKPFTVSGLLNKVREVLDADRHIGSNLPGSRT